MSFRTAVCAALLSNLLLTSLSSGAQQAPQNAPYTLQANARLVVLDVVVTDNKGNVVTNLQKEDFEVLEEKEPQKIASFESPGRHSTPESASINSTAELDRLAPDSPTSIIILDELNTRFEDMAFARYSLKKYLDAQPAKLLQPTMLVAVNLQHFTVLADYTQDKKNILSSLDHHFVQYPWHLDSGSWKAEQFSAAFAALMQVAEATIGHPGHKNMIWVGRGFPSVRLDQLDSQDADKLDQAIQMCINMLRDARVTLYTVDPVGLAVTTATDEDGMDVDDPFGGNIQFNDVAKATGGKSFFGRNDVNAEIGTSVRDGNSFYTLSYSPSSTSNSPKPFRSIRVVMKNPNLHAVTREGYYSTQTPEATLQQTTSTKDRMMFDLVAASNTTLVYDGVPMTLTRDASDPGAVLVHVSHEGIPWTDDGPNTPRLVEIEELTATFDRKNKLLQRSAKTLTVRAPAPKGDEETPSQSLDFHIKYPQNPLATRVRVVVRFAKTGKVGAANLNLLSK